MGTWCIHSEKIICKICKIDFPYNFKKIGYNTDAFDRLHAWLLIQSWLTALLTS